jgi:hypothetical protein
MQDRSLRIWQENLFTMKQQKPYPDDFDGIRNKISELGGEVKENKEELNKLKSKPTVSTWAYWEDHKAKLTILLALLAVTWYVYGLILDSHIGSAIHPLQEQTNRLDGDIRNLTGIVSVLQSQVFALRFSAIPPSELKSHVEELKKLKTSLAQTPPVSPGYWPAAFQVIELFSQSAFTGVDLQSIMSRQESSFDNVGSNPPGGMSPVENSRVVLKNLIQGMVFKNSIVRFDPSVRLVNDVFINCVFIFPAAQNPSRPLQEIGKTLLASDLSTVTLNAS